MNMLTIEEFNKRDLERSYFSIYFITTEIYIEDGANYVKTRELYLIFGCTLDGKRKYITSILDKEVQRTSDWYNIFQELKKRKVEHIIFALIPEKKEVKEAITLAFPEVEIYNSCDNTIEKLKKYNSYKTKDEIYNEIRKLYLAKDIKEYEINYNGFIDKYKGYPFIMDLLEERIRKLKENYKYSYNIRRVIYSFNYVIELKKRLVEIRNEQTYKTKEEYMKRLEGYIRNCEKAITYPKLEWIQVINEVYEEKKEYIKPYL